VRLTDVHLIIQSVAAGELRVAADASQLERLSIAPRNDIDAAMAAARESLTDAAGIGLSGG